MGCQPSQPKEQAKKSDAAAAIRPLRINIGSEPQTLDPRKTRELSGVAIMRMLFEGLVRTNLKDEAELALAESVVVSPDEKIYTFTLRKSLWSNGDPVTADDFVYAWRKMADPLFASDYAFQLYMIKNVRLAKEGKIGLDQIGANAPDPYTLVVELEQPIPYFLDLLSFPAFYPVNRKVDAVCPEWAEKVSTFVSNGPFVLKEWRPNSKIQVKKNDTYWDALGVKLSEIEMILVKADTEFFMFQNHELDWAGSPLSVLPLDAMPTLKQQQILQIKPLLGTFFLRVNTKRKLLQEEGFRKALAYAINRQKLVEHVTLGNQLPAQALVPPTMGLQKTAYFSDGDLARAQLHFEKALQKSKTSIKNFPELKLMYAAGEKGDRIAQAVQQQWNEAFGIHIVLEPVERENLL